MGGYKDHGIRIGGVKEGYNTVRGNYIGTNFSRESVLAYPSASGISIANSGFNTVGPNNVITNHGNDGLVIRGESSFGNHITMNSIYDNEGLGIALWKEGNSSA